MAINIGKRDVQAMAEVLDGDYESVEDAAAAALAFAFERYESKAKFTVVGQLHYSPEGGWANRADAQASMVALGRYGTETAAYNDAKSFAISTATGEQFRAWVLPVFHGTPAAYYSKRKETKKKVIDDAAVIEAEERFKRYGTRSMETALKALAEENGWVSQEERVEEAVQAATCPECGNLIDGEHDGLASGYEVTA